LEKNDLIRAKEEKRKEKEGGRDEVKEEKKMLPVTQ